MDTGAGDRRRLAVLLACHDRRATTLAGLAGLERQEPAAAVSVFLVDDASSDGTADAVRARFPSVHVLEGSGDLYWVGAMRTAQEAALAAGASDLLFLNDDVVLAPDALRTLYATADMCARPGRPAIVVGAVADPDTGRTTYSGLARTSRLRRLRFTRVRPGDEPQPCETFHGNVVLVPEAAQRRVGLLDGAYTHTLADLDYGLRASRLGVGCWVAPGHVGTCPGNPEKGAWSEPDRPLREQMAMARGVKALPPAEWRRFARRYAGPLWPVYFLAPYARLVMAKALPGVVPSRAAR